MASSCKSLAHGLLLAVTLSLAPAGARADDDCDVPVQQWQSRDAVLRMAAQQGWDVQRLKIDDGCYELRGKDAQGRAFKAKLDPQSLRVVKMTLREPDRERDRHREGQRARQPGTEDGAPPRNAATPAAAPPPTPGSTPRGRID